MNQANTKSMYQVLIDRAREYFGDEKFNEMLEEIRQKSQSKPSA